MKSLTENVTVPPGNAIELLVEERERSLNVRVPVAESYDTVRNSNDEELPMILSIPATSNPPISIVVKTI